MLLNAKNIHRHITKILMTCALGAFLSACGIATSYNTSYPKLHPIPNANENGTRYKIGNPYYIKGRRYIPHENYTYSEKGSASWYGPNFHGKKTANGGVFDMYRYTAAHRTLPLPSLVRVTNLENGKTIVVKINDRGPFAKDRIIDLSKATAEYLGVIRNGTAWVQVDILPEHSKMLKHAMLGKRSMPIFDTKGNVVSQDGMVVPSAPQKSSPKPHPVASSNTAKGYYIQAGVYANLANALKSGKAIQSVGKTKIYKHRLNDTVVYAVRIGPFEKREHAHNISKILQKKGIDTIIKQN